MNKWKIKFFIIFSLITFMISSCGNDRVVEQKVEQPTTKAKEVVIDKEVSLVNLSNEIHSEEWKKNLLDKINKLEKEWTNESLQKAIYLKSFMWKYSDVLNDINKLCKKNSLDYCKKEKLKLISFYPTDKNKKYLKNVKISVNWWKEKNLLWENTLELNKNFINRVKISAKWYTDFYKKINIVKKVSNEDMVNPKLIKAKKKKTIDSSKWIFEISTKHFSYTIAPNTFVRKNWEQVNWNIDLYLFDIDRENADSNLLSLDVFDSEWNNIWNWMVTYWMPLIKAYLWDEELKIWTEITWKWKIMYITKYMNLKDVPKWKYLSKKELEKYNIPPFWILNQDSWVWNESKMKILDEEWNYEFKLK